MTMHEVAAAAGMPLHTWKRTARASFESVVRPLNPGGRPLFYDAAQVIAHINGEPVPRVPTDPSPDDLLTDEEVAKIRGVDAATVRADAAEGRMNKGVLVHDRRLWTREAAEQRAAEPAQYRGRTPGTRNRNPRPDRDARAPEVAAELEAAAAGTRGPVTRAEVAERYRVNGVTADRIINRASTRHT